MLRVMLGQPCRHCGVVLTRKNTYASGGGRYVVCKEAERERKLRRRHPDVAEEPEPLEPEPDRIESSTPWARAELVAAPSVADGGLHVGAVVLFCSGAHETALAARLSAERLLELVSGALRRAGEGDAA